MRSAERWLEGRHAVVTGASRGIGAAIANALAGRGASITLMARSADALDGRARSLRDAHGVPVAAVACDVSKDDSVRDAFARAADANGSAHVLVNNAGVAKSAAFLETTRAMWDETLAVDLTGVFLCSQAVLPAMLAAKQGRIVNIASTSGLRGHKTMAAYCAAKHGVIGLTRVLALETAAHGITVNAVCPGYVETDLFEQAVQNLMKAKGVDRDAARAMLARPIPTGRFTTVEEVAGAVDWLCSPPAANVTGIALPLTGGEVV
jgi:NAD(P)-dependent dehydrogenase (short-subunit alcohol dehydrogenase family)